MSENAPSDDPERADPLVGTVLAERYRIVSLLGIGGMGKVYRAEHVHMRKPMALKVLHPQMKWVPDVVARFEREAIAAGRIEHPNVAAATDFGQLEDGAFYMVMEYLEGRDLADVLANEGSVKSQRAIKIALQISEALAAAHEAGVVHRDLKPENVFLLERPDDPEFVKVLDFGIAKVNLGEVGGEQLTKLGTVFGTPQYMSPEQAAGQTVDHRADLYTVGVLLFEMLTGAQPFTDEDMVKVLKKQIEEPPPPLPDLFDPALVALVGELLSKDPNARPATAADVAARLRPLLEVSTEVPLDVSPPLPRAGTPTDAAARTVLDLVPPATSKRAGRVQVPIWALFVGALALVAVVAVVVGGLTFSFTRTSAPTGAQGPAVEPGTGSVPVPEAPPEVAVGGADELSARAATGDEDALRALEGRPVAERTAPLWLAIGRGKMKLDRPGEALVAYREALKLDPSLARDRTLLAHVHRAAKENDTAEEALRIAAHSLGSDGADLLYDVWVATRAKTTTTQLAKQLAYDADVRKRATPALDVALDLRQATTCQEYKELLPRATLNGDVRSHRVLQPLGIKKGCGVGKKEDCHACLREGTVLDDALAATRARPEPRFF